MTDSNAARLSEAVDADRVSISKRLDPQSRKQLGQFMTPAGVARLMASMFSHAQNAVQLLDAGAGMGSLISAYVDAACSGDVHGRSIAVTAVERDSVLAERLRTTLQACAAHCADSGIAFSGTVIEADFIEHAFALATPDGLYDEQQLMRFDAAILNPPYAKLGAGSRHRLLLRQLGIESTNLYAAFVALAIRMLRPGGELVAIIPRSFCNGPYFRPFRQMLLRETSLRRIHIYESRSAAFSDDAVLQENVILHAVKGAPAPVTVKLSVSTPEGITARDVSYDEVIDPADREAFIHIAGSDDERRLADVVLRQPCTLAALGITVSTGRVVDFRARAHLRKDPESDCVPLIYPAHFDHGFVSWPRAGGRKPNALHDNAETRELLVPDGIYVLTKRFTSKEERRRLVACVYEPSRVGPSPAGLGFENHLNYFHARGQGLSPALARGLAAWLNSTAVDRYFRQFSGHTQVNANDLRSLKYPHAQTLESWGDSLGERIADQTAVDALIAAL